MSSALSERGLRPVAELARDRLHGDRLRYMAGCRCTECRRANTQYEIARSQARKAGDWNGIVLAAKARAHMDKLSRLGIGRRVVHDVSGVANSSLVNIINGRKQTIRARTERAILAVTVQAAADHALVDAAPTWRLLDELIADGYSKAALARALGYARPAIQFKRANVTVRNAYEVARLHERLRMCDARQTVQLLQDLSEEGFHRRYVERLLRERAQQRQADAPDLQVRRRPSGHLVLQRIRQSTADLVRELHAELTA